MKKISHLCMLLLLLCTTFFVLNVNVTREIVRIQEMGKTTYSFDLYLKDVTKPTETILQFFEEVANQDKVSIIKVDNGVRPSRLVFLTRKPSPIRSSV